MDDGTMAYLHAGGLLAEIDGSDDVLYHLTDGLGSVRGLVDDTGTLVGTAEYEAFGGVSSSSGAGSAFGFTGELTDPTTGFVHLRARDYNPATGRFVSMDTVQPNAPGTQGYNRCAYVANNPATWTDPSGQITQRDACTAGVNMWVNFQMRRWLMNTMAWGWLLGTHRNGAYAVAISAGLVTAGAAAELFLGPSPGVQAGEAIAGGTLIANSLAISFWAVGNSHMSIVAASMILLAGVLLLLLGAILGILGAWLDWSIGMYRKYSLGGLACSTLDQNYLTPMQRGSQSPDGADAAHLRDSVEEMPETPTYQLDGRRPNTPLAFAAR